MNTEKIKSNTIWEKVSPYLNWKNILILFLIIFLVSGQFRSCEKDSKINELRRSAIEKDSLRKIDEGQYARLVNDLNTVRDVANSVKESNRELYDYLKANGKKPIIHTITEIRYVPVKDTTDIVDNKFELNYPNIEESFIKYNGTIFNNKIMGEWNFSPIQLDLTISEVEGGLFEADIKGNKWIQITKLKVETIPLAGLKPDNFGWLLGAGGGYGISQKTFNVDFYGGMRYKNINYLLRVRPDSYNSEFGAGLIYEFK